MKRSNGFEISFFFSFLLPQSFLVEFWENLNLLGGEYAWGQGQDEQESENLHDSKNEGERELKAVSKFWTVEKSTNKTKKSQVRILLSKHTLLLFLQRTQIMEGENKCSTCSTSTANKWYPLSQDLIDHFCRKVLRNSELVCNRCYMEWYMVTHEVRSRQNFFHRSPPSAPEVVGVQI